MFRWRREIERLDIDSRRVYRLHRSLGDIQVALAGLPSQAAAAYLCAFALREGFRVAVALHLKGSGRVAFYLPGEEKVDRERLGALLEEGIRFVESMGFMMGDTEIHRLQAAERESLWNSLPLLRGGEATLEGAAPAPPAEPSAEPPAESPAESPAEEGEEPIEEAEELVEEAEELVEEAEPIEGGEVPAAESVPAAFLPAGRSEAQRRPLTVEEMARRRKKFLEGLGRFLSSF